MRAAITAVRRRSPLRIVVAVPVASRETVEALSAIVEDVICLITPAEFRAVGYHYDDFHQLDDREVISLLADAARRAEAKERPQ